MKHTPKKQKVKRKYCRKTYKKNKKVGHERERKRERKAQGGMTLGVGDGQGGLWCCGSWGHKELDMTERLN